MKPRITVDANGDYNLGKATEHSNAAVWVITVSGAGAANLVPMGYQPKNGLTSANADYLGYRRKYETDWTNPAVTPISANGVYEIEGTNVFAFLRASSVSGGGKVVDADPADG